MWNIEGLFQLKFSSIDVLNIPTYKDTYTFVFCFQKYLTYTGLSFYSCDLSVVSCMLFSLCLALSTQEVMSISYIVESLSID